MKEKTIEKIFILVLIILGIYYMYLASQTQMLGEDEAGYYWLGKEFSENNFPLFEKEGVYNAPVTLPVFVPLIYSLPFMIFGASLSIAKIITVIFGILTVLLIYLLGKKTNIWYGIFSASLLFSIPLFTHFMLLAYVDVPIAFFSALTTYLILTLNDLRRAIFLGIILGLSYHTKATGLYLIFMAFIFSLFYRKNKKIFKLCIISIFISALLISPIIIKNIVNYDYPYFEGLNYFFKQPKIVKPVPSAVKILSPNVLNIGFFANTAGWLALITTLFGLSWFIVNKKNEKLSFFIFFVFIFISLMIISYVFSLRVVENRYMLPIFPQMTLLGGFFLWKLKEKNNYFMLLIIPLILFSFYISVSTAQGTANSQRYPEDYIQALEWIKKNTPKDSTIFTPYGGSVKYFAERNILWWKYIPEFEDMMKKPDGKFISKILKEKNVSYILVWRGILAEDIIIPKSNIIGAMTYKFANTVINDVEHFNITYQNQNNVVLKVL